MTYWFGGVRSHDDGFDAVTAPGSDRSTRDATFVIASRLIEVQGGEARVADDALEVRVGQR